MVVENAHIENCVVVPDDVADCEREKFAAMEQGTRPSIGEQMESPFQPLDIPATARAYGMVARRLGLARLRAEPP